MVDWFVLLTPLAVLPIVWLLVFVGCGLDDEGSAHESPKPKTKPVTFNWTNPLGDTTAISFDCIVREADKNGVATGVEFKAAAVGPAAWPGSKLPASGTCSALVTLEVPPAATYEIEAHSSVTSGVPPQIPKTQFVEAVIKPFPGGKNFDAQEWTFTLNHGPNGWELS